MCSWNFHTSDYRSDVVREIGRIFHEPDLAGSGQWQCSPITITYWSAWSGWRPTKSISINDSTLPSVCYRCFHNSHFYTHALRVLLAQSTVARSIHVEMILYVVPWLNVGRHVSALGVTVRDEGNVAGEGRVVGIPKFHSWHKFTMPLTNINSDRMSNTSSACVLTYITWVLNFRI